MRPNREKQVPAQGDLAVGSGIEDDPEETNFELYLMKKSKLKSEKLESRKHRKSRLVAKGEDDNAQDSARTEIKEKAAAPKVQSTQMQPPSQQKEAVASPSVPQNFIDVPDYGFIGLDGSYQAPF